MIAIMAVSERMSKEIKKTGMILARLLSKAENYSEKNEVREKILASVRAKGK